jgi:anti-sigma-K factor RskA
MMSHDEAYGLIEAYAFGTLDEEELSQLEAHLDSGCAECSTRLREVAELSAKLAEDIPQFAPPPHVKENILSKIKTSGHESRSGSASIFKRINWMTGVAAVVVIGLLIGSLTLVRINRDLRRQLVDAQDVTGLLKSPGMQFVDLQGVDPNPQAFGKVVMDPNKGAAVVYMYRLPQTPEGMAYQLWVMREGKPTSAGMFTVNDDGSAMLALEELSDPGNIASFLVTIEPEEGQAAPTGMMYLTGPNVFQSDN